MGFPKKMSANLVQLFGQMSKMSIALILKLLFTNVGYIGKFSFYNMLFSVFLLFLVLEFFFNLNKKTNKNELKLVKSS